MPVDLDTQLRALGDALVRESEPITLDELGTGDVIATPPAPTRRRWASAAAIATAAAAIVGIVVVGQPDDARRPGTVGPAPSSAPERTDPPASAPPLIGVTSFPLVDDPVAVGLTGSPEATLTSMPATVADGVGAWRAVLGRTDGAGYSDLVVVQIVTDLRAPNANGHVDTSVRELPGFVEYVFDTGDVRIEVQADITADTAQVVRQAVTVGGKRLPEIALLPAGLVTVVEPFPITAEAGHFPVLSLDGVSISVEPSPAAGLAAAPGGTLVPVTIAGRTSFAADDGAGQINLHSVLDDATMLNISASGRSMDEVVAIAEAVRLVDQRTWIERYQPRWVDETGITVDLPAAITVPAPNTVPATTVAEIPLGRALATGLTGDDVAAIQQRLVDLGFDPGPIDGAFGEATRQAVWAFEKLVMRVPREQATGTVSPEVWARMQQPLDVVPRRPQGAGVDHVEIYLPEQVLVVFHSDEPVLITHISTGELDENGEPANWCETLLVDTDPFGDALSEPVSKPICGTSKTPGGIFDVDRIRSGTRVGPLGAMWNPIYFSYALAIHGARNVPLEPASHGNVRVPMHVSDHLPDLIPVGTWVYVWDGQKEPEDQTRENERPVVEFPWPDPSAG